MQVCFRVDAEESEGEWMGSDGVGDGKGKRGGHTMTMPLDSELECKLKDFQVKLHAEWWKDKEDHFLGPHIFLNCSHIQHLCNLASTGLPTTIDDLHNNFKWNWMDDHSSTLLSIIHNVYGAPNLVLNCSLGDAEISEGQPPSGPSTAFNSKSHTTPQIKKGAGSQ